LGSLGRRRHFQPDEIIFWEGEDPAICGNVIKGALRLTAVTGEGREQNVGALYPADFIGRPYPGNAAFTVTAMTAGEICLFSRTSFENFLSSNPKMERRLLMQTLATLDSTRRGILTLTRRTAAQKLAGFLIEIAARDETACATAGRCGPVTFDLPFGRRQVADVLGLTIETVSRQLTKLKSAGIIALPGIRTVTIRQKSALQAIAD